MAAAVAPALLPCTAMASAQEPSSQEPSPQDPSPQDDALQRVLDRLDGVAGLYRDTALRFSCEEKIIDARSGVPSRFHEFEYVYEFSEIAGLLDFRVDRRARHRSGEVPPRARLSDYGLPYYLTRGYSWIFLFDRQHQPRHRFTPGEDTTVLGRPAVAILFEPLPPIESDVNDWFGTLWADRDSLQPLRVEAIKAVERGKEQELQAALKSTDPIRGEAREGWAVARVRTEFTQEKNGMRFPGRIGIEGTHIRVRIRKGQRVADRRPLFTVTQLYTNYRFFGVKTREEIRKVGLGERDR